MINVSIQSDIKNIRENAVSVVRLRLPEWQRRNPKLTFEKAVCDLEIGWRVEHGVRAMFVNAGFENVPRIDMRPKDDVGHDPDLIFGDSMAIKGCVAFRGEVSWTFQAGDPRLIDPSHSDIAVFGQDMQNGIVTIYGAVKVSDLHRLECFEEMRLEYLRWNKKAVYLATLLAKGLMT